ncbi:Uma2 family endonuclease [Leptolyngbya boryana CZ1]|uniref:Uma2 family endonuclease n=1 Tax=Leptolyngbya boryana CZ1 TaxID=3060204 RepID=A0AA96WQ89_LEPBY|nr:Uma2 family endonuclease [Leptolyngbya boryana]WNZ43965.1 Uma2 family endonuclease [Leptolyngbya boryana CZ1]
MVQAQERRYSPEEYLELETEAEARSEYLDGKIIPMTGGTPNHNRIAKNVSQAVDSAIGDQDYESFMTDLRLWIPKQRIFTYPDVMVVKGSLEYLEKRKDTITNPVVIVEVLSDSTKNYDRGEKFEFYRTVESFQEYILIDQYKIHVEQFSKTGNRKWQLEEYEDENDTLAFASIPFQMSLAAIYKKVEF